MTRRVCGSALILIFVLGTASTSSAFLPVWKSRQNVWKTLSSVGAPASNIIQQRGVRVGSKVYLWGGNNGSATIDAGYVYDLGTQSWSAMPTTGSPPSARFRHAMAAVGTKIFVWGGQTGASNGTRINTGAFFDTATQTWTAMSNTGAPTARGWHAFISTGTKLIVWGGANASGNAIADGKIYDPATNEWTTVVSTTDEPPARALLHSSNTLWVGDKMFVWGGGTGGTNCTNTGGLYDPVANTWQVIPTTGAPAARCFNTAVWTGSKVIVWGGDTNAGGSSVVNTGGIYDVATNTWTGSTTTTGAPTARHWHGAFWSPAGMVLWGGFNGGGTVQNSGKLYDPANDRWSDMSATNATTGTDADAKMISFDHFLFHFDTSTVRAYFP